MMLYFLGFKQKSKDKEHALQADESFVKIRNIHFHNLYALDKTEEERFFNARPDELIGCRPLSKSGALQKVKAIYFRRNELKLVS